MTGLFTLSPDAVGTVAASSKQAILEQLSQRFAAVYGLDPVIVLERIEGAGDLPRGVRETQGPGAYRLEQTGDDRLFEWAHGPDAAKRFLFPPRGSGLY